MEIPLFDWLNLLLRWLHVVAAIAWIGASFYFVWLDNSLEPPDTEGKAKGLAGELWAFHGGGIYQVGKYRLAPPAMPTTLHWFKWEAYTTWISGALLMVLIYYGRADLFLWQQGKWLASPAQAVAASLVFIAGGLLVYELLFHFLRAQRQRLFTALLVLSIAAACWLATRLFSDRAAFLQLGALLATIMAGNVLLGIIPAQKHFIRALDAGEEPAAAPMLAAKSRSVHNNYFTLPVVFCMLSNHYPFLYGHRFNWLALIAIVALGAYVRHFFNLRHRGQLKFHIPLLAASGCLLLALGLASTPTPAVGPEVAATKPMPLVEKHCTGCHSIAPTQPGFSAAPAGLVLDDMQQVLAAKDRILPALRSGYMPLGNITGMSKEERQELIGSLEGKTLAGN
ncbi:urate hydroxylase PuuD [Microbulbifer rhizosphaerae]|uniref:Putative membrane protein n=1 Tax=Microbulbifer rhizosphaerae TaxID=1562603 RepID=A0A7W4ZAL1_9GAMM|nr:urate hydroxylase PuuD [Microbulbifer rhizosphaerae]MBB3062877.1 putative membrane protein [Microbulbifer rhizosphaerae]